MNVHITQLVQSLFQKDSLEKCSLQELEQYVERHPYFGAAQLLLAKKLQVENSARYPEQLEKTYLFFHNPLWVEHLLNDTGTATIKKVEKKQIEEKPAIAPEEPAIEQSANEQVKEVIIETKEIISSGPDADGQEFPEPGNQEEEIPLQIPALKIEPIDPSKAELFFQPYHTVDYFASQGIKVNEDEIPKDKFTKQLKSFTDWLKSMKRLPEAEISSQLDSSGEKKVEQMAEHSLMESEVVTESMAQVWEKQGNPFKAMEIYNKLSLLDPSKSTYFAAKIENLKKSN